MTATAVGRQVIRFKNNLHEEFNKTLNKRVNNYFKTQKYGRHANAEMIIKTVFMFALYFTPYLLLITGVLENVWACFLLYFVMGVGKAGIGLSVMHDANHGAYSKKKWVNNLIGYSMNVIGGNATNWKIQHNIKHHTYTNVTGMDEDISPKGGILRFDPNTEKKPFHKWQFIYAWVLYGLMTISWTMVKDITQLKGYTKDGMLKKIQDNIVKAWTWLITTKIVYCGYMIVIPILFSPFAWWHILIGFLIMHYVAGFILAIIFQPAHVMEHNTYEDVSEKDTVEENWAVHQLKTTCNFANKNWLLTWYAGGLNFQIEHHLFPNICHVHYRKISKIVRETAAEYGIPYRVYPTFTSALISHGKMLYLLGR